MYGSEYLARILETRHITHPRMLLTIRQQLSLSKPTTFRPAQFSSTRHFQVQVFTAGLEAVNIMPPANTETFL